MEKEKLLEIDHLSVEYRTEDSVVKAVNDVTLRLNKKETLGLVGETGAGKTTLALSILRLLPKQVGRMTGGKVLFEGRELTSLTDAEMRAYRGKTISMIFQDPMTSLNPVIPVGKQVAEILELHNEAGLTKEQIEARVDEMFELVGIPANRKVEYPHQFSGGMKQRVVIAIALACSPKLLLADEPTTALDVTIQAQVLDMMCDLKEKFDMAMVFITHDLGIVAQICDEVAVMYAGRIIERGTLEEVFNHTKHPYTEGLFNSLPDIENREAELKPIQGMMPDPTKLPMGCAFAPRCPYARPECINTPQKERSFSETHKVLCSAYDDPNFKIEREEC